MKERDPRTIRKAEEVIDRAAERALGEAYERLEKERHGQGCGCRRCRRDAVDEMNRITDFISKGTDPIEWFVDDEGNIDWRADQDKLDAKLGGGNNA